MGDGIDANSAPANTVVYGNLIFNNGWRSPRTQAALNEGLIERNGHGIYTQNNGSTGRKRVNNNLFVNPYYFAIKAAGSEQSHVQNFEVNNNLVTNSGSAFYAGDSGVNNVNLDNMIGYRANAHFIYENRADELNNSLTNSYLYGYDNSFASDYMRSFTLTGNTLLAGNGAISVFRVALRNSPNAPLLSSVINNNTYYIDYINRLSDFAWTTDAGVNVNSDNHNTFAQYKAATGWDANSTYVTNGGTARTLLTVNKVFVQPSSDFFAGFGYVAVYNWQNLSTQAVNLSAIVPSGTDYEIHSAANYFGGSLANGAIAVGTYTGGTITLPLTLAAGLPPTAQPYGDEGLMPESAPNFAAFVIVPMNGSAPPSPTPTPTPMPTPTPTPSPTPYPTPTPLPHYFN